VVSTSLDLLDRRIIQALYLDPRASFSRLSDILGSSEQTVARRYRRLFDGHVVRIVGQLDSQRLGRSDWVVRIRCAPGSAPAVATRLAQHPDTAWVQLASGGTEIFSTIHSRYHDHAHYRQQRTPLLLSQLSVGGQVVALEAYCLLHLFAAAVSPPPGSHDLRPDEIDRLGSPARSGPTIDRSTATLQDTDWPLVEALADDGRASYRQLAARTHWHESTVRRRIEELVGSGVLAFDVDLDSDAVGLHSPVLLWISVVPSKLVQVGQALAAHPEIPFVAATTGPTNLVAALLCRDDRAVYDYVTGDMATLDGLTHVEISPVMRAVKMHATMTPPTRDERV
jgi:DNA-binding Lrp family transcriptional regulator